MTDLEHVTLQAITQWQETLSVKTHALRKGLSHWWLDIHEGQGIEPGTRSEIQSAITDMREWLDAIEGLATDPPQEPTQ